MAGGPSNELEFEILVGSSPGISLGFTIVNVPPGWMSVRAAVVAEPVTLVMPPVTAVTPLLALVDTAFFLVVVVLPVFAAAVVAVPPVAADVLLVVAPGVVD